MTRFVGTPTRMKASGGKSITCCSSSRHPLEQRTALPPDPPNTLRDQRPRAHRLGPRVARHPDRPRERGGFLLAGRLRVDINRNPTIF
jgi:hypothetical protein